ncbi:MAG: hypothetical protein AB1610_00195 [Nitrospirota bacterium]
MKKAIIILTALILTTFIFTSCQKAKEPEKKEVQVQQEQKEERKQQPSEMKPEAKPQQEQQLTTPEVKEEKSQAMEPSLLTEEEQRFIKEKWDGIGPGELTIEEALKALKILLKVKKTTEIKYYAESDPGTWSYGGDICELIGMISGSGKKEAFDLILEVLKRQKTNPLALSCALKHIQRFGDKSVVPILKEYIVYRFPQEEVSHVYKEKWIKDNETKVRLQAAGTLLAFGEADKALPVLDELARQGEVEALPLLFEPDKDGVVRWSKLKFWDERGLEIMKRAIDYPSDEVKGWAAIALVSLNIEKEKVEEVALNIVKKLMYKTTRDYGFEVIGGHSNPEWVLLPNLKGENLQELRNKFSSDIRACNYAISTLGRLKSKRAIPLLRHIKENNTEGDKACWENNVNKPAEHALERIIENGGDHENK